MKRLFLVVSTAIVILPWLAAAKAQADAIQWSASGSPLGPNLGSAGGAAIFSVNDGGNTWINLVPGPTTSGTNSGSVVLTQLFVGADPDLGGNGKFGGPSDNYSLSLALHDDASGASGSLTFRGGLSGWASVSPSNLLGITNIFLAPTTQTLKLGGNLYTVTIGPFDPTVNPQGGPGPGSISASIAVQPTATASSTPEPSSLVLACLGLPSLGLARCFRRRKGVDGNASNV